MPICQMLSGLAKEHDNISFKLHILGKTVNEISQLRTPLWALVILHGHVKGHPTHV